MADNDGGLIASFQFHSFKIDRLKLEMEQLLGNLVGVRLLNPDFMRLNLRVRPPVFQSSSNAYFVGLDSQMFFYSEAQFQAGQSQQEPAPEAAIVRLEVGIAGVFTAFRDRFPPETEVTFVKIHAPAILMPYVRGAASSILALSGFGSVPFPLINVHELAKESLGGVEIKVID